MLPSLSAVWGDVTTHWSTYLLTLSVIRWYVKLMKYNERRPYLVELPDPSFAYLPVVDTSGPVTFLHWSCILTFVWHWSEWQLHQFCWTFLLFMWFRAVVLWAHPFRGHSTMIPLRDVCIDHLLGVTEPLRNDESFSGHTAIVFMCGLYVQSYRWWFWLSTLAVMGLLVLSRVHYLADCLIAPPIVYSLFAWTPQVSELWTMWCGTELLRATVLTGAVCLWFWRLPCMP